VTGGPDAGAGADSPGGTEGTTNEVGGSTAAVAGMPSIRSALRAPNSTTAHRCSAAVLSDCGGARGSGADHGLYSQLRTPLAAYKTVLGA
jgi:hypothetical protein